MNNTDKALATNFHKQITSNRRNEVFKHLTDEQFSEIKKSFRHETTKRNDKRYYRYENALTHKIEWTVESRLGSHLKSVDFRKHLKSLNITQSKRNQNSEVYVYPESVKKPHLTSEQLEKHFQQDPNGKSAQSQTLKALGNRPVALSKLQY